MAFDTLIIIAISSFNRQNCLTPIDFGSFRESGGIEYTADVLWGLQPSLFTDERFFYRYDHMGRPQRKTFPREKWEMVQKAKASTPRSVDLVCLKNRYGRPNYAVSFDYYPASDFFCQRIAHKTLET